MCMKHMYTYIYKHMYITHPAALSLSCSFQCLQRIHTPSRLSKRPRHAGYDTDTRRGACIGSRSFVLGSRSCVRAGRNEDSDNCTGLAVYLYVYVPWCVPLSAFTHIYLYVYLYIYIYSALQAPVYRFGVSLCCWCVPLLCALSCVLLSVCTYIYIYIYVYIYIYTCIHICT